MRGIGIRYLVQVVAFIIIIDIHTQNARLPSKTYVYVDDDDKSQYVCHSIIAFSKPAARSAPGNKIRDTIRHQVFRNYCIPPPPLNCGHQN